MKSKFMRMVGRGVEDPEEEEQVFQEYESEEEQEIEEPKILPHISDAEIDGFFDRFLSTGFESPYFDNKRLYVLDVNSQLEEFLKKSDLTNKIMTGGNKKKKRLVGGVTAFDKILKDLDIPLFNEFLDYSKDFSQYNDIDIENVIKKMESKIDDMELLKYDEDYIEKWNKYSPLISIEDFQQMLRDKIDALRLAQQTDVSPQKDILEEQQFNEAKKVKEPVFSQEYGMTKKSMRNLKEIKNELGLDDNITSGKILKNLELFKQSTQIDKFITDLHYVVKQAENTYLGETYIKDIRDAGIKISKENEKLMKFYQEGLTEEFITKRKAKADEDERFLTNDEWDENKWNEYIETKKPLLDLQKKVERIKEENKDYIKDKNYFKLIIKDLFIKTLHNPLIGNYYFDETGKLTKSSKEIAEIISDRTTFVNDSRLKEYDYNDTKEVGNIYEYYEGLAYSKQIAEYIKRDFNTNIEELEDKEFYKNLPDLAYNEVVKHFENKIKSLSIIYGFYTGDIERIDNIITFWYPTDVYGNKITTSKKFTINIETKASGRVSTTTITPINTIENDIKDAIENDIEELDNRYNSQFNKQQKGKKKKESVFVTEMDLSKENYEKDRKELEELRNDFKSYHIVYTGTKKLLLLLQQYFNGLEDKFPTTYCYNSLYYKNDSDIIYSVRNKSDYNIRPDSASLLDIQNFVSILDIKPDDIKNFSSQKKRGRPVSKDTNEEEEENSNKEFFTFLKDKLLKRATFNKGLIYQVGNYENIYFGIPALDAIGIIYDLDNTPQNIANPKINPGDTSVTVKNEKYAQYLNKDIVLPKRGLTEAQAYNLGFLNTEELEQPDTEYKSNLKKQLADEKTQKYKEKIAKLPAVSPTKNLKYDDGVSPSKEEKELIENVYKQLKNDNEYDLLKEFYFVNKKSDREVGLFKIGKMEQFKQVFSNNQTARTIDFNKEIDI